MIVLTVYSIVSPGNTLVTSIRNTYAGSSVDNIPNQFYLNQDSENVRSRLRANKLTLNMTKTEFMLSQIPGQLL